MKITLELLRSKSACSEGMSWVEENLPEGAEYQDFLDALAAADKPDWASWLLANFGKTTAVKTVTSVTAGTKHIFAAGRLVFECPVRVLGRIQAGESIEADMGIKAGESIKADWGIKAGGSIEADLGITCKRDISVGFRIFAGVCGWKMPSTEEMTITCHAVKSGIVAFGVVVNL